MAMQRAAPRAAAAARLERRQGKAPEWRPWFDEKLAIKFFDIFSPNGAAGALIDCWIDLDDKRFAVKITLLAGWTG
jgi:hypothetical protein